MHTVHQSLIGTDLFWDDLVLDNTVLKKIKEIKKWLKESFHNDLKKVVKKSYQVLFIGPPGKGKTLTAALIGKEFKQPVYKIDLTKVKSKYIDETEKNLQAIFATAENKDWILFFDEADALFKKRTTIKYAHDRYSNAEVSYLLQCMKDYNGLTILSTKVKDSIDKDLIGRFQSVVHFPYPFS
jgi:SpoVK/Ycf46/Vps4 family AAA+-type ATPase